MKKTLITHVLAFIAGAVALIGGVAVYDKLDNR